MQTVELDAFWIRHQVNCL